MSSPLEAMKANRLRQQVKVFVADNAESLENEMNEFLVSIRAEQVIDIKYSSAMPEPGILLCTGMVVYETLQKID